MIVVDTNVITYLFMESENTARAVETLKKDPDWAAPILWRSEFRNVLAFYIRTQNLAFDDALKVLNAAEDIIGDNEFTVTSMDVLKLAEQSGCSAYDCEFVALANDIGIPLVTADKKVLGSFGDIAVSLEEYAG